MLRMRSLLRPLIERFLRLGTLGCLYETNFDCFYEHDINWRPYLCCKLPNTLQSQSDSRRFLRLGPIFNNNYVVHHRPDRVLAQFGIQDDDISISMIGELDYKIKFKDNRGKFKRNYEEIFKRELDLYRRNIMLVSGDRRLRLDVSASKHEADEEPLAQQLTESDEEPLAQQLKRLRVRKRSKAVETSPPLEDAMDPTQRSVMDEGVNFSSQDLPPE
ncbi:hypothetical protein QVD17_17830 [Tagetes erecta]|uniref:Uncharacterized protein n=1 Tax=Tagetes erecta TaxID=13708 RepID=A0AAD8KLJ3_TARER|nr:hypothetical protein QVD17_17830 [Tagetes erecta]